MIHNLKYLYIACLIILFVSCGQGNARPVAEPLPIAIDTVSYSVLGKLDNKIIIVKDTINLKNRKCFLPDGVTLWFKGGLLKNGTLVGNKTQLKTINACFSRIRVMGSWKVPVIKTSYFDDLSYDNALKDVVALSDSLSNNKIIIGEGRYQVTAQDEGDACILVNSNTDLEIRGEIWLTPNEFRNSNIIQVIGRNIRIYGKGTIIGDKHTHTGDTGEWGMGIDIENAHHTTISGLTIKDCWGDCIYIGSESSDILIKDCNLDNGRRQGVSVTSANGVKIKDCIITNVSGTAPEFAIDIEPNRNCRVDNVIVDNVHIKDCQGGIKATSYESNAKIGSVEIRSCDISANEHFALKFVRCNNVFVEKCEVRQIRKRRVLICKEIGHLEIRRNTLVYGNEPLVFLKKVRELFNKEEFELIGIIDCESTILQANKEYTR